MCNKIRLTLYLQFKILSKLFITQTYHYKTLNRITSNNDYNSKENSDWELSSDCSSWIYSENENERAEKEKSSEKQKLSEEQNLFVKKQQSKTRAAILNCLIKNNLVVAVFLMMHDDNMTMFEK